MHDTVTKTERCAQTKYTAKLKEEKYEGNPKRQRQKMQKHDKVK